MSTVERTGRARVDRRPHRSLVVRLAIVLAAMMVATTAVLTSAGVRHQLALSLTRVPTPYTELYFAPAGPVARTVGPITTVRFALHSHEAENVSYHYRVTAISGGTAAAATGTVDLQPGAQQQVSVPVETSGRRWQRIEVVLLDRPERIAWRRTATNEVVPL